MTDENILSRAEFQDKLNISYSERPSINISLWNKKQECTVIKCLQEVEEYSIRKVFRTINTQRRMNLQKLKARSV